MWAFWRSWAGWWALPFSIGGFGETDFSKGSLTVFIFLPLSALLDRELKVPEVKVVSEVEVQASAQIVWKNLLAFPPIPQQRSWLFHTGVAYPTHAEIKGSGPGSVRYCHFSTGTFVEPIDIWEKPRRLGFSVTERPEPMKERGLYGEIHPPHLNGYLITQRGEFVIEDLPSGGVRLIGTTWYQQDLWPNLYWRWWTDWIIGKIHHRVLSHIANLSEAEAATPAPVSD